MPNHPLVLASSSPRRQQLLADAGYRFEVLPPSPTAEGEPLPNEAAADLVLRLARAKAADVACQLAAKGNAAEPLILGCDTVAEINGEILGKPADLDDAARMLRQLRGRRHRVLTGLCLLVPEKNTEVTDVVATSLLMRDLSDEEIGGYLATDLWQGKAGAFGLQDCTGWIEVVEGSESNVVGLPLERLSEIVTGLGRS